MTGTDPSTDHSTDLSTGPSTAVHPPAQQVADVGALRQIAFLSARPEHFARTLAYVRHFMPWLTSTVVVTPGRMAARMRDSAEGLTVLTDEEVLPRGFDAGQADHVTLNYRLRVGMCLSGALDEVFLCSDDDYRPLKAVGPETFVRPGPDGRLQLVGYTFYDLYDWVAKGTPFDKGQQNMLSLLALLGAEQRAYASHMPQALDRDLFVETAGIVTHRAPGVPVDEWSIHFNLGRMLDPGRFTEPQPYQTLGWPEYPGLWRRAVIPREYSFENFYPALYQPGYLYEGLSTTLDTETVEQEALEKLRRWRNLDLQTRKLEPLGVHYPLARSPRHDRVLRRLKRELDWLLLASRSARPHDPSF